MPEKKTFFKQRYMMSIQIISETNDCKVTLKDEFHIFKKQMVTIKQIYEKKKHLYTEIFFM